MIYLDNAATTRPIKEAIEIFDKINAEEYYNPSALYSCAFSLSQRINNARKTFLSILGDNNNQSQVIFTSGATESNNIAIFGCPFNKNGKYLFSMGEHPSVYNCAVNLKMHGYNVEFIPLQTNGQIDYDALEKQCDSSTQFVSTMFVSNETGAINDLERIGDIVKSKSPKAIFHVDAVQGFCKLPLNVVKAHIDLCSLSAHKIGGLKACGALYIKNAVNLKNITYGGGQEFGLRSGTVHPAAILSFEFAAKHAFEKMATNLEIVQNLKNYFVSKVSNIKKVKIVSSPDASPYIISIICEGNRGETIMRYLDSKGIIVGTGSACSSQKVGNRVLENMKYTKNQILGSFRISFNPHNTTDEIDTLVENLETYFNTINA